MKVQVLTVVRNQGNSRATGKPFDFYVVGGLITTARGVEFAEFMYDSDNAMPESGKSYEMEISLYPNREKKLSLKVENLRAVVANVKAA